MSTERDELAEIIQDCGEYIPGSHADDYVSPDKAADAILAAGYRKPRTVTTAAELDALPHGAVLLTSDSADTALLKDGDLFRNQSGAEVPTGVLLRFGTQPFTVLFEGEK